MDKQSKPTDNTSPAEFRLVSLKEIAEAEETGAELPVIPSLKSKSSGPVIPSLNPKDPDGDNT